MSKLIQNAIKTHDGVILISRYTHDYVSHNEYSLDGGNDYIKISYPVDEKYKYEELFIYEDDPIDIAKNKLIWGTFGENKHFKYVKLYDCTIEHLTNILNNQTISKFYEKVILYIIDEKITNLRNNKIKKIMKNV